MSSKAKYPCGICGLGCGLNSIECSSCEKWIHRRCVPLSMEMLQRWSLNSNLTFFCKKCAFMNGSYNIEAALKRLSDASNTPNFKEVAESERLMLETYGVIYSDVIEPSDIIEPSEETVKATGGTPLLNGKFLGIADHIRILSSEIEPLVRIPTGVKENEYFLIDNSDNISRKDSGRKCEWWDDCGAWEMKQGSPTVYFLCKPGAQVTEVVLKDNQYCLKRRKNNKVVYLPLEPQPPQDDILQVHRNYAKLKLSRDYQRRVTYFGNKGAEFEKSACVEYIGKFPGRAPHGKAKDSDSSYIRMPSSGMEKLKGAAKSVPPQQAYRQLILDEDDIYDAPRNKRQISNAKFQEKKTQNGNSGHRANFADHVDNVQNLVHTHPFVQNIFHTKGKVPSVVLYTKEQIDDIKRFCCNYPTAMATVLGFDKTFNLGEIHVTIGCYKNLSVTRKTTKDHPIFPGPVFLHGNSDFSSYKSFFSALATALEGAPQQPIFGTDDEKAMRKAIDHAFPGGSKISCHRHLKNNVLDYLKDKVGMKSSDRTPIIDSIFGSDGITSADDSILFEHRVNTARQLIVKTAQNFQNYFEDRLLPLLQENFTASTRPGYNININPDWTNNNCESLNHVLKQAVNWKAQNLTDLITAIYDIVQAEYKEVERSLLGVGGYILENPYKKFAVPIDVWTQKPKDVRERHFNKFLKQIKPLGENVIRTTDGMRMVLLAANGGKKPGQVKRKRTAKTTSAEKRMRID